MDYDAVNRIRVQIEERWRSLEDKPFPDPSIEGFLVEIKADLANICTFAQGCVQAFIKRGRLGRRQKAILLRCLDALQVVEGKLEVNFPGGNPGGSKEVAQMREYISDLQRVMEATLIGCFAEEERNGSDSGK